MNIPKFQKSTKLYLVLFACLSIVNHPDVFAGDIDKTEALILESAEKFFISLKERNYKTAWGLISEKSQKTIIDDIYNASRKRGADIEKENIIMDFNRNGIIFNNYWDAFLNNFDPDVVLNERVWELEGVKTDYSVILLKNKNKNPTRLQMYKENDYWKVGFVETFWPGKTREIISYLSSLLFR